MEVTALVIQTRNRTPSELLRSVLGFRPCADVVSPGEAKVATSSVCWGIFSFQGAGGQLGERAVPLLLERVARLR